MARLNIDFYKSEYQKDTISGIDRVIRGYIMAVGKEDCDKVIEYDPREEVFMHLSSLRKSTISWYPFKEESTVLEIEGGFGSLTGALCEKAAHVVVTEASLFVAKAIEKRYEKRENLDIYVGDVEDITFSELFDYIVLVGLIEKVSGSGTEDMRYVQYLRRLTKFLKPEGKFLIAENNLYSVQLLKNEENQLIHNKEKRGFHRKQLQNIVKNAGLEYQKFYYPMPDYRIVGSVYSDECFPDANEWEQLESYEPDKKTFIREEMDILNVLVENEQFPFFANSFFLEAGRTAKLSEVKSIVVLSEINVDKKNAEVLQKELKSRSEVIMEQLRIKPMTIEIDQDRQYLEPVIRVQLDLLKHLKRVCDKHDLQFFMIYGTLLGAVRHGGLIPGDDDIDVALPREDYNKLLKLNDEFTGEYFLQTPWNDNCFFGGYIKLRNKNTTAISPQNWWVDCCEGIAIDIFPLDNGYCNQYMEKWKEKRLCFYQRLLYAKSYGFFSRFLDMPLPIWKFYKYLGKPFTREKLADKLNFIMAEGDNKKESPFGVFAHYTRGRSYRKLSRESFNEVIDLAYEDMLLPAPAGRYEILYMLYGADYLTPSIWCEGKRRHGFYVADVPYQEYKKRFTGLMRSVPADKEIVLFGDGLLFEAYFKRYKDKYIPKHIVLMEEECVAEKVHGIKTERFQDFNPKEKTKIYPVICSIYIREAEAILQQAGYEEYYIFVQNREWLLLANPSFALREIKGSE